MYPNLAVSAEQSCPIRYNTINCAVNMVGGRVCTPPLSDPQCQLVPTLHCCRASSSYHVCPLLPTAEYELLHCLRVVAD